MNRAKMPSAWVLGLLFAVELFAGNWPRFLGPNGAGRAEDDADPPVQWSDDQGIAWKTELPGDGCSSPCVVGDRVIITAAADEGRSRLIVCYDRKTGKELWRSEHTFESHAKHKKNTFATATSACNGVHVINVFTDPQHTRVYCHTVDGKKVWEKDLGPHEARHGSGAAPIIHQDKAIVVSDQDGPCWVAALEIASGAVLWRTDRDNKKDGAAYSSPIIYSSSEGDQLIISSSGMGISSYDPSNGKLRWRSKIFEARCVGSPFVADGLVMAISGSGNSGKLMAAVRPTGEGDVTQSHLAWKETKELPYCPTPLAVGPLVFMILDIGVAKCIEAKTGEVLWTKRLGDSFTASPVYAKGRVYYASDKGNFHILAADKEYKELGKGRIDDYVITTPALAGAAIYVRGQKHLWCIGKP